jgi:hypothetical protein
MEVSYLGGDAVYAVCCPQVFGVKEKKIIATVRIVRS